MLLLSGLTLSEQQQQLETNYPQLCVKCAICKIISLQVRAEFSWSERRPMLNLGFDCPLWKQAPMLG